MTVLMDTRSDDPLAVRVARLDNGLTVLLSRNDEQPRVYCRVVVRAGAAQEPRETTGLAHYLEHMLANKGSRRLGTLDYQAEAPGLQRIASLYEDLLMTKGDLGRHEIIDSIAAESAALAGWAIPNELKQLHGRLGSRGFNAFTSHDQTSYVVDIPAERLAAWATVESDRFAGPVFRSFQTEVETICEEKKRSLDVPGKQTHRALMSALWAGHPYADPVLGRSGHLESPSIVAMQEFFTRWYVPGNMAVVLCGDLDPEDALKTVNECFRGLPSRALSAQPSEAPPMPVGEQRIELTHRAQPELRIGWRTVPAGHPDELALALLDEVLHNDATGAFDALTQVQAVRSAGCFHSSRLQGGSFCAWGRPRAGQTMEELEGLVLQQINAVQEGVVGRDSIIGILRNLEVEELAARETNKGRAGRIADAWLRGDDPQDGGRILRGFGSLTPEDVQRVARTYLGADRVVLTRREGEPSLRGPVTPSLPALPAGAQGHSKLFAEVMSVPARPAKLRVLSRGMDFSEHSFGGVSVVRGPNPHNDIVRLAIRWTQGWDSIPGLDFAAGLSRTSGACGRSRSDVERELFELATTVDLQAGRWTTDLALAGPLETMEEALGLALERFQRPEIPAADAHREVDDLLLRRVQARASRQHHVRALSSFASRGSESVYLQRLSEAALRELADVGPETRTGRLSARAVTALLTGPLVPDRVAHLLGADRAPTPRVGPMRFVTPLQDRVLALHHPSKQAQITIHSPQDGYRPDDYGPRRLWAETLGGAAGLVFQEVREKRGMAYSAHAGLSTGWRAGDPNLAWLQAGTEASKASEVAVLLLSLLRGFPAKDARLSRVRESTHARRASERIGFRSVPATVLDWRGKGILADPLKEHLSALRGTTDAQVRDYARVVGGRPVTISVVGDLSRVDMKSLSAIAPVTELTLEDIVVS